MGCYICLCLAGRPLLEPAIAAGKREGEDQKSYRPFAFLSSHLAMIVTLSIPALGLWLLTTYAPHDKLFTFRLDITLLIIFMLTRLLSIKQAIIRAHRFVSLRTL